jgi:hypothetical protein
MIHSARELPLVYRAAEAPAVVNVVEPLLQGQQPSGLPDVIFASRPQNCCNFGVYCNLNGISGDHTLSEFERMG